MAERKPTVVVTTRHGRYEWVWAMVSVFFIPKGKQRATDSWFLGDENNTREGAVEKAVELAHRKDKIRVYP